MGGGDVLFAFLPTYSPFLSLSLACSLLQLGYSLVCISLIDYNDL